MVLDKGSNFIANAVAEFKESPLSVKNGLTVLMLAWGWHLITLYYFFLKDGNHGKHIVTGLLVCLFVFLLKNWGRVLCIVCNILIVAMYILVGASFYSSGKIYFGLIALMNVSLFSLATYFLAIGSSAAFFKSKMPKKKTPPDNDSDNKKA